MRLPASLLLVLLPFHAVAAPITIRDWHVIGPFESGSREGLVHPLAEQDGRIVEPIDFARTWPSALADLGRVGWKQVAGDLDEQGSPSGVVALALEGVDWDAREKEMGLAGLPNVAVLAGSFHLDTDALILVDAARCAGTISGQPFAGDPYGAGIARSIVRGRRGENRVVLMSAGFGPARNLTFRAERLDPAGPTTRIMDKDLLLPMLVTGREGLGVAGVPVLNLADTWQDVIVEITGPFLKRPGRASARLAPFTPMKLAVDLEWDAPPVDGEHEWVVTTGETSATTTIRVVAANSTRTQTFRSRIDGSAQEYGVRPSTRGERQGQALVLSTHGAGVGALGQVNAYGPKDGITIVAPTNRRPFGFDWHDWGRLDFEEVLDLARARFRPNPDRVHLTGHSMGGHGAWSLGTLHADEFATVSPSAAWASYDTYVPFTMRRSTWLGSPELNALLMRGLATGRSSVLLENLRHVPVQVLHGGKDDNVPPTQARMLTGLLERLGGDVTYVEAPGEGHWSDLDLARPGADSVDPAIMDIFWTRARDPFPRSFVFATPDPDVDDTRHWLRIDEQETCASESRIEADATDPRRVILRTRNVMGFSVLLPLQLGLAANAIVEVDGRVVEGLGPGESWRSLRREISGWTLAAAPLAAPRGPNARPGGLAKALFTPFLIVLPTQGDAARNETLAATARLIATAWWVRGNGMVSVVRDTDLSAEQRGSFGLLLLGGPELNAETARIEQSLRLVARAGAARLDGRSLPGSDLACAHWQPHPEAPAQRVLVLQATSAEADLLLPGLQPIAAGLGLPDFIAASPRVRVAGFAGFVAAGFWAPDWTLDPASTWLAAGVGPVLPSPPASEQVPTPARRPWRR